MNSVDVSDTSEFDFSVRFLTPLFSGETARRSQDKMGWALLLQIQNDLKDTD